MDKQVLITELKDIISDYLRDKSLDLVEFIYKYEGRDLVLRIMVDKPEGGISLDECARLNQDISRILDEKDILKASYTLEVSSPGLDRPLKTEEDFLRCINRKAHFFLNETINDKLELEGVISSVKEGFVYIDINGQITKVDIIKINKAKQILE